MKKCENVVIAMGLAALFSVSCLVAWERPNRMYLAPVVQNLNSTWDNETKQNGWMEGLAAGFDFVENENVYWGAEFNYAAGPLKGTAGNDPTQEYWGEGRVGYTFSQMCIDQSFTFTPFVGVGFYEFNQDIEDGLKFTSHFWYVPFGLRIDYLALPCLKVGIHGSVGPMFGGQWHVNQTQSTANWLIWRVETPVTWAISFQRAMFDMALVPYVREWAYDNKGSLIGQKNLYIGIKLELGCHY